MPDFKLMKTVEQFVQGYLAIKSADQMESRARSDRASAEKKSEKAIADLKGLMCQGERKLFRVGKYNAMVHYTGGNVPFDITVQEDETPELIPRGVEEQRKERPCDR